MSTLAGICGLGKWDSVIWDSVIWDLVIWDSVIWDSVIWDLVIWDLAIWDLVIWDFSCSNYCSSRAFVNCLAISPKPNINRKHQMANVIKLFTVVSYDFS
jgi:hypothetical protein